MHAPRPIPLRPRREVLIRLFPAHLFTPHSASQLPVLQGGNSALPRLDHVDSR